MDEGVPGAVWAALGTPNFRRYFAGQWISQIGSWVQLTGIGVLVLRLTDDGIALGVVTALQFLPILLIGLWSGLLVDRSDRLRLLIVANGAGLAVATLLAVLVLTELATLRSLFVIAALIGVVAAVENPARRVFLGDLLPHSLLANGVGLNSMVINTAKVLGPLLAAGLITTVGIGWCFALNAASFVVQLMLFARIDRAAIPAAPRLARGRGQIVDGLRAVARNVPVRQALIVLAVVGTTAMNWTVLLPLLTSRELATGPAGYPLLLAVQSVGSIGAALWFARRNRASVHQVALAALALGVGSLTLALSRSLVVACLMVLPLGAAHSLTISGTNAVVQTAASPATRGRALALLTVVFQGSNALGAPLTGWFAEWRGSRWALVVGGAIAIVLGGGVARSAGRHQPRPAAHRVPVETR